MSDSELSEFDETFITKYGAFRRNLGEFLAPDEIELFELRMNAELVTVRDMIKDVVDRAAVEMWREMVQIMESSRVHQLARQSIIKTERMKKLFQLDGQYTELLELCHGGEELVLLFYRHRCAIRDRFPAAA